jgi:FAD/FMN-containing dehydrogenase
MHSLRIDLAELHIAAPVFFLMMRPSPTAGHGHLTPAAAVAVTNAADAPVTVRVASRYRLAFAVRSTGHQVANDAHDVVLIDTHRRNGVYLEPRTKIVRVEAGVTWAAVAADAAVRPRSGEQFLTAISTPRIGTTRSCGVRVEEPDPCD